MEQDYYGGDDASPSSTSDGMAAGERSKKSASGMGEESTLVPRSMFGDQEIEVGEEYYFKVLRTFEKEVEIAYSKGEKEPESKVSMMDDDTPDKAFSDRFSSME